MSLRQLQVTVPAGQGQICGRLLTSRGAVSVSVIAGAGAEAADLVIGTVALGLTEEIMDDLDARFDLGEQAEGAVAVLPVEALKPELEEPGRTPERAAREELRERLDTVANLDLQFLLLTSLSAVVATFGLLMDDAAVVVGAMVIAPLLGPIVAFTFGVVTVDGPLIRRGLQTEGIGLVLAVFVAALLGAFLPGMPLDISEQIALRARPSLFNLALAISAGTAGALSITTGLDTALVGVMVAVALLPPASVFGLGLGRLNAVLVRGAGLLLVTNITGIALASILTFRLSGLGPGEWWRRQSADRSVWRVGATIAVILVVLATTLVPATIDMLQETRVADQLLNRVQQWAPGYVRIDRMTVDLQESPPRVSAQLRSTRPPNAVDVAGLFNLVSSIVPGAELEIEISQVSRYELNRRAGSSQEEARDEGKTR